MLTDSDELRIAIPSKGRLMEQSIELLKKSGLKFHASGRQLFARCKDTGIMVIFVNAQDIPLLVEGGMVDLGVTGSDLVSEKKAQVTEHMPLGFGRCRLSFATHIDSAIRSAADFAGRSLGTKFVNTAREYFSKEGVENVRILEINGAVEVMVLLGLVDGILDIVETGSSLREHDLVERETVLTSQAVLIGNPQPRNTSMRDRLLRRIEGVLVASRWSLLEYNCPCEKIAQAKKITPGYSSPTIQKTDSENWLAVKVMVEKDQVQSVMDQLETIGCRAIIESGVLHCRL